MAEHLRYIIFLVLIFTYVSGKASPKLLTATVGQVGEQIITSREVQINYLLEKVLYVKSYHPHKLPSLKWEAANFGREVSGVLLEWVVYLEARNFAAIYVTSLEVDRVEKLARARLDSHSEWKQLEVIRKELRSILGRKVRAKKFIKFKAKSSVTPITDKEAMDYFEKNRVKFGNFPFGKFKDSIKSFLTHQQVDIRMKDWFEILQAKYKVRNRLAKP